MNHRIGISLIEVMAASTILAIGLGSTFSAMGTADATRRRTEDRNAAIFECQNQIEILQAKGNDEIYRQFATNSSFSFPVTGLTPPSDAGRTNAGIVEKLSPSTTVYGCTTFRVRCDYQTAGGVESVQFIYLYTRRNYGD